LSERTRSAHWITSAQRRVAVEDLPAGGRFLSKPYVTADVLRQVGELLAA